MGTGTLFIDHAALARNWRALDAATGPEVETGAVVKADGYGLGLSEVATTLAAAGARRFFVAAAEEGAALRRVLGPGPEILVFGGHMARDGAAIEGAELTPMLNSVEQITRHFETTPAVPFGLQLDSGMNRLGMEPAEWAAVRDIVTPAGPALVMSHLACADTPDASPNAAQLAAFREMTDGLACPRSLSATGGVLLGAAYHFDVTRPGIGLYGGLPFAEAEPVVRLTLPVIQTREVAPGETVGYGAAWEAADLSIIATVSGGYGDGLMRCISNRGHLWHGRVPCPVVGRVSMDLITVDITHLADIPETLDVLSPEQPIDDFAGAAGTIGYEVLTALGGRYRRRHLRETS